MRKLNDFGSFSNLFYPEVSVCAHTLRVCMCRVLCCHDEHAVVKIILMLFASSVAAVDSVVSCSYAFDCCGLLTWKGLNPVESRAAPLFVSVAENLSYDCWKEASSEFFYGAAIATPRNYKEIQHQRQHLGQAFFFFHHVGHG